MRGARFLWHLGAWLALAALAHLATVWAAPRLIMRAVIAGVPADVPHGVYLPPMTDHTQRRIVMPSPDLLYAICTFDLRERALRVRADPQSPHYWSIALYASNSDNFFVLNDEDAAGRAVDLVLRAPDTPPSALPSGARGVTAPGTRGLLLMRLLVADAAAEGALPDAARRTLRCEPHEDRADARAPARRRAGRGPDRGMDRRRRRIAVVAQRRRARPRATDPCDRMPTRQAGVRSPAGAVPKGLVIA